MVGKISKNKSKNALIINVGSSSLKFSLFEKNKNKKDIQKIISGKFDKIGTKNSEIIIENATIKKKITNYKYAINELFKILKDNELSFDFIGHRVVHGGDIKEAILINKKVEEKIKEFSTFAPLHNPHQLEVINICKKFRKKQFAVFDTTFYSDLPKKSSTFPIPIEVSKKYNLKKYGFHGTSHKFVSNKLKGKTITCHLGNGSSISAIKDNKVVDTSMGLTPLGGLMMSTRPGDLDPGLIIFLKNKNYSLEKLLNYQSGFKAFSEFIDIRDVLKNLNNKNVKLAYDVFIYNIIKFIGAYSAILNGLDNLVFTGGIGENVPKVREDICKNLSHLGLRLNLSKNKKNVNNSINSEIISSLNSKIKIYVRKTNEEYLIAKEVYSL